MPWENMQCWNLSINAGYKHSMIRGKARRPIRARESGSHGSKGPHAGVIDLGQSRFTQTCHQGPLTSPAKAGGG